MASVEDLIHSDTSFRAQRTENEIFCGTGAMLGTVRNLLQEPIPIDYQVLEPIADSISGLGDADEDLKGDS